MPASSIVDLVMHIEFIASLGAFLVFDSLASYYSFAISRASIDPTYRRRAEIDRCTCRCFASSRANCDLIRVSDKSRYRY